MEIWLKKDDNKIQLPVLPTSYELTISHNNQVVNVNNLGDINLHGNDGLKKITLSSFFPAYQYDFNACKSKKPYTYVNLIDKWRKSGYIRLVMTNTPVNMLCTIDSFTYGETGGNGDVEYSITLTEYKIIGSSNLKNDTVSKTTTKIVTPKSNRETKSVKSTSYTVKAGDTLTSISKTLTGTSNNWRAIYNQNKNVIGDNPNYIKAGMILNVKVD